MSDERWALWLLEQERLAGGEVAFTPEQIGMLQEEANDLEAHGIRP